jgi:transcriptional/translational regulatory protein YebC/TACO1
VSYLFLAQGMLRIKKKNIGDEEQELELIDAGADDLEGGDGEWVVFTHREKTFTVKESVEKQGYQVLAAELVEKPTTVVNVSPENQQRVERMVEQLEEIDEVTSVWTNYA